MSKQPTQKHHPVLRPLAHRQTATITPTKSRAKLPLTKTHFTIVKTAAITSATAVSLGYRIITNEVDMFSK
jgi:hypothetical protein